MGLVDRLIASSYDFRMKFSRKTGLGISVKSCPDGATAPVDFYSLSARTAAGAMLYFKDFGGRKILLVNLASKCGFTPQYKELQTLHLQSPSLVILGFPSNNFGGQEPGSNEEIARFCDINYHITFPVMEKGDVRGPARQPVYQWLTDPANNGWNAQEPKWNFYKYLVDETGRLVQVISSSVSPLDIRIS